MARLDTDLLRLHQSVSAMGSTFSIVLYGRDRRRMEAVVRAAFDEVRRLDALLSTYRRESECSLVNRRAGHEPVAISSELFRLLSICLEQSHQTDGAFDITIGPLKRAWGFFRGSGSVPAASELSAARKNVGYRFVQLDEAAQTVQFDHPGVEIDLGGIGKGYAVDRVVEILRCHGFDTALVAGSTSSLYGLGTPPSRIGAGARLALGPPAPSRSLAPAGWRADVRDSEHRGAHVADVFLSDASLSTSGTGERCFWSDGNVYSHILDPRTARPLQRIAQASVVAPRAVDGEVWAKACLLNGPAWAAEHTPHTFRVICEGKGPEPKKRQPAINE